MILPELGDIKSGIEIGFHDKHKRIWAACEKCGKERWVYLTKGEIAWRHCRSCQNKMANGRSASFNRDGYCYLFKPTYPGSNASGVIAEHRYIVEQSLGRYLSPDEVVHHINTQES